MMNDLPNIVFIGPPGSGRHCAASFLRTSYGYTPALGSRAARRPRPGDAPVVVPQCEDEAELDRLRGEGFVIIFIASWPDDRDHRLSAAGRANERGYTASHTHAVPDYEVWNEGDKTEFFREIVKIIDKERVKR